MTIADINSLPVITLNVTGREGSGTSVTVIDQESKESTQVSNFTYIQGESLTFSIEDQIFVDRLEKNSTLSVILYDNTIPLYRDIVRFNGELNTANEYTQYNNEDDYFIYESEQFEDDDPHVEYGDDDVSGSDETDENVTVYIPSASEGMTSISLPSDSLIPSTSHSVYYDTNNDGRGEMKNLYNHSYAQDSIQNIGDFKVRSAEYGTFNDNPSSLEPVVVYEYDFNTNTGNTFGYHPQAQSLSRNPNLVNTLERVNSAQGDFKYFHFSNGRDESFSDRLTTLIAREENSLDNSTFETTVYKEDSISDWTVGMSIYSDATGTSVTDNYVDNYANGNDLDRYHFISKNSSGVWVLVRCTDGIVTHVEAVDSVNYVRISEMHKVSILNTPYETQPARLPEFKTWIEGKLSDPEAVFISGYGSLSYTTVKFSVNPSASSRATQRVSLDLQNGVLGSVGDRVYYSTSNWNANSVFHNYLASLDGEDFLLEASDQSRYETLTLSLVRDTENDLDFNEQPLLLLEIDNATGLISDREWINL